MGKALVVAGVVCVLLIGASLAATSDEIENAIETGITWLAAQQETLGYWEDSGNMVGPTGLALIKLQDRAFELGYTPFDPSYPYKTNVENGLAYLFSKLKIINITTQPAGNPDSDGDGIGVYVNTGRTTYDTGIALSAIAASRAPDRIVNSPGSDVHGWTYRQVLVDMVDYMAFGQIDGDGDGGGSRQGGWGYSHNESNADNSNSGYAVSGLGNAASAIYGFNCAVPQFVKNELKLWIDYIQTDGGSDDGGSGYSVPGGWVNILKTGNLLFQMTFAGSAPQDPNMQRALAYIGRKWNSPSQDPGWGNPGYGGSPRCQAVYCAANGLQYSSIETIAADSNDIRYWYADFADALVNAQNAAGYWPAESFGGSVLATEWALLALEKSSPLLNFEKTDDVDNGDCRQPDEEITYTISWQNNSEQTFYNCWIIDYLPAGVTYSQGFGWLDPNFVYQPGDSGYDIENHTYVWYIGEIEANGSGSVQLTVKVNEKSEPGMTLHNVAELHSDDTMLARDTEDTPVCCWDTGNVIYVDKRATGNNNGISWQNAYTDLQKAIARATYSTCPQDFEIWAAFGTYSPGASTSDSFIIPADVSLYGGFAGTETDPNQRNPALCKTILTGLINETTRNQTVIVMSNNSLLDGVIVQDAGGTSSGQGVYGKGVTFTLLNCAVENNKQYGIYTDNSNVTIKWCRVENNGWDGIYHDGNGKTITVDNCQIMDNLQNGTYLRNSVALVKNNTFCRNGLEGGGYFGIRFRDPKAIPSVHNNTIVYNQNEAIAYADSDPNQVNRPDIRNCIIYYNNPQDPNNQMAGCYKGFSYNCCIQDDPNDLLHIDDTPDERGHITCLPGFAYDGEPNNVHLAYNSPCKDRGNTSLSYTGQVDLDGQDRIYNDTVDIGADEITCEDIYNLLDWNADGLVNTYEFVRFSCAWLSHDPNDPVWLADPNIADPSAAIHWDERCNLDAIGDSAYEIDLADLLEWLDGNWLWVACWKNIGSTMMAMSVPENTLYTESLLFAQSTSVVQESIELSAAEQIILAKEAIEFFERLWKEEPEVRKMINKKDWASFMDELYKMLNSLDKYFESSL